MNVIIFIRHQLALAWLAIFFSMGASMIIGLVLWLSVQQVLSVYIPQGLFIVIFLTLNWKTHE